MSGLLATALIVPFFVDFAPEVRTTYQSIGKIVEDRPMQVTDLRAGYDAGAFGRFGVRNWDVSSLTGRRDDVHRRALYHTEFGPTWDIRFALAEGWTLANDVTYSWTIYRGFDADAANKSYQWVQIDQSLENPFLVPFYRLRRCFVGNDYLYAKVGVRRRCPFAAAFYVTPSVYWEGGNRRNAARVFGDTSATGGAVTFRLEVGWAVSAQVTAYAFVEQYEVFGGDTRTANDALDDKCAHNDWTHGGVGVRMKNMNINRRNFFKGMAAASALPLFNIGCAGFGLSRERRIANGAKIRVALIGCGLQTRAMIDGALCEDLVAIVDPDPARFDILKKYVAETCGAAERANFATARRFATYQDMFEKMAGEIDAIVVETPNHQHVLPAVMALRRGIHVYLDKPLCLTSAECDLILDEARKHPDLVTQCGTYGHSFPSMKYCVDRIAEGALGEVKEVWAYDDRCNSIYQRPAAVPPPKGMDWDLWCGGSPVCDYYPDSPDQDGMHPHGWHSWIGYGNGSIGNMGTHVLDAPYQAMDMWKVVPSKVVVKDVAWGCEGAWNKRAAFDFSIPLVKTLMLSNMPVFAGKGTHGIEGDRMTSAVANAHAKMTYRTGWNPLA